MARKFMQDISGLHLRKAHFMDWSSNYTSRPKELHADIIKAISSWNTASTEQKAGALRKYWKSLYVENLLKCQFGKEVLESALNSPPDPEFGPLPNIWKRLSHPERLAALSGHNWNHTPLSEFYIVIDHV